MRAGLRRGAEVFAAAELPAVRDGFAGVLTVDTRPLGLGPVALVPVAAGGGGRDGVGRGVGGRGVGAAVRVEVDGPARPAGGVAAGGRADPRPARGCRSPAGTASPPGACRPAG